MDPDGFLGRAQVARWVATVCMAKMLLHHRTGVLARMYVHIALSVACTKQLSWAPVHVQICRLYRCSLTSVYISANTPSAAWVCTYARVRVVCSLALGDEGRGVQLVYAEHLLLLLTTVSPHSTPIYCVRHIWFVHSCPGLNLGEMGIPSLGSHLWVHTPTKR